VLFQNDIRVSSPGGGYKEQIEEIRGKVEVPLIKRRKAEKLKHPQRSK